MHRLFKMAALSISAILSLQSAAFSNEDIKRPPKPAEGIESSNPDYGSSMINDASLIQSTSELFYKYYCSITDTGTDLYLEGSTVSNYLSDQIVLALYLQKWDGSKWVDVQNWTFTKHNAKSLTDGARTSYQLGNYYRTRAVHNIVYGSQSETQNSTSSYIYIQ